MIPAILRLPCLYAAENTADYLANIAQTKASLSALVKKTTLL